MSASKNICWSSTSRNWQLVLVADEKRYLSLSIYIYIYMCVCVCVCVSGKYTSIVDPPFSAKPLSEPMPVYCKVDRWHQIPMKNISKCSNCHTKNEFGNLDFDMLMLLCGGIYINDTLMHQRYVIQQAHKP